MRDYLCSNVCSLSTTAKIGSALDRAPRPYTAKELADITQLPLNKVKAFLRRNTACEKVNSHSITRIGGGRPIQEYWRGMSGIMETFEVDNMMDNNTVDKLMEGKRPVSWRDGNYTSWSIDEANNLATMRGGSVVRLGKTDNITCSAKTVSFRTCEGMKITFRRV